MLWSLRDFVHWKQTPFVCEGIWIQQLCSQRYLWWEGCLMFPWLACLCVLTSALLKSNWLQRLRSNYKLFTQCFCSRFVHSHAVLLLCLRGWLSPNWILSSVIYQCLTVHRVRVEICCVNHLIISVCWYACSSLNPFSFSPHRLIQCAWSSADSSLLRHHPHQCVREKMPPATGGPVGYTPPEGGWGWAVVVGAFISIGFSYAFPKSITVFFKEIEVIFNATSSQVSWISSIMLAVMYAGGQFWLLLSFLSCLILTLSLCQKCNTAHVIVSRVNALISPR